MKKLQKKKQKKTCNLRTRFLRRVRKRYKEMLLECADAFETRMLREVNVERCYVASKQIVPLAKQHCIRKLTRRNVQCNVKKKKNTKKRLDYICARLMYGGKDK